MMTTITSEEEIKEEMKADEAAEQETAEDTSADEQDKTSQSGDEENSSDQDNAADDEKPADKDEEDEELNVKYMRLMADFQNFKRRSERERSEIYARANEGIVTQLLDVADNFERALSDDSAGEDENFRKGMQLIFNQVKDVLTKSGVAEIEAEGAQFDPNFHNAVMMEDTDKVESGKVSEVLQKGYTLNGRVIRPSMVKVAN
jgi:molecular chaperone GrpE